MDLEVNEVLAWVREKHCLFLNIMNGEVCHCSICIILYHPY